MTPHGPMSAGCTSLDPTATPLYAQLGCDDDTRNAFNKGIVNGGLGLGVRF